MLSMLVTTKVKVNRLCSVLKTFSKMFSYQRAEAAAPGLLLLLLDHAMSLPDGRQFLGSWRRAIVSDIGP